MGRPRIETEAARAAMSGGPPLPLPVSLNDLEPILIRWPMMLKYDPASGELWWRYVIETHPRPEFLVKAEYLASYRGAVSGTRRLNMVRVDGLSARAASVVWLLHHGRWPDGRLGRRDDDYLNDRIENLFEYGTHAPGARGRVRFRPPGVCRFYDRWRAFVDLPGGGRKYLGTHATEADAKAARAAWDAAQSAAVVSDLV